jgi:hypothetical protein
MNETFLSDMRDSVKALMEAEPYYSDIPIISERLRNIEAKILETVGRAGGLAILLVTPIVGKALVNVKGANFEDVQFVARIFENTKTNATGKEALDVAIFTAAFWSQLKPDSLSAPLRLDEPAIALGNDPRYLTYDVAATTSGGTKIDIPRLEDVTLESIPNAAGPVETFNDGTRAYTWREADQVFVIVGAEVADPERWVIDARSVAHPESDGYEMALFYEIVGGLQVGYWIFRRVDGVWIEAFSQIDGSVSVPPVMPSGFEFFTRPLFSLTHPNAAATIFYTLDGSPSFPRSPAATLFQDSFNAAPGATLRARAWLPGYIPSAELKETL